MSNQPFADPATQNFIRRGLERLRDEFRGIFSAETIQRFVDEAMASLSGARLKEFVPLFVNRFARERLQALQPTTFEVEPSRTAVALVIRAAAPGARRKLSRHFPRC